MSTPALNKIKKQKKRKATTPLATLPPKVAKVAENTTPHSKPEQKAPKSDKPKPAPVRSGKVAKPANTQCISSSGQGIEFWYVDRKKDATLEKLPLDVPLTSTKRDSFDTLLQKPTANADNKAKAFMNWLLWPLPIDMFMNEYWEKRVFAMKRHTPQYYQGLFSRYEIEDLLQDRELFYGRDMDVTLYKNGKRHTLNLPSEEGADPDIVWELFNTQKCSLRILRPQQYSRPVSAALAMMEEFFASGCGTNAYLTPAHSQGFAPHWDDVEAFVVQLEGSKSWKIHALGDDSTQILPRYSSDNFNDTILANQPPILEITLEPGDIMYFPRGTIHQAVSSTEDSLHITLSTAQKNAWADLMENVIQNAMAAAFDRLPELRESLPRDYVNHLGVMHSDSDAPGRAALLKKVALICNSILDSVPEVLDDAADTMACRFLYDRQPPQNLLSSEELGLAPEIDQQEVESEKMHTTPNAKPASEPTDAITEETQIRLVTRHCIRLVTEEDCKLYYANKNTEVYHEMDPQALVLPIHFAESIEFLFTSYPKYVAVKSLPGLNAAEQIQFAEELSNEEIIMLE